jgi:hypothetical protein
MYDRTRYNHEITKAGIAKKNIYQSKVLILFVLTAFVFS